ncbi:MAG: PEPxxWA-CTERM sorting domain-containing protein [Caulobacteraceae bacterium]
MNRTGLLIAASAAAAMFAGIAQASTLYFQGFESDSSGWNSDAVAATNPGTPSTVTRTASGGGTLKLTAYQGGYYGEVTNNENAYIDPGYGAGGYTLFGNPSGFAYPGSPWQESIAVYINVDTPSPHDPADRAFSVDAAPSSSDPNPNNQYGGEMSFNLYFTGSSASVGFTGGYDPTTTTYVSGPVLSLSNSGWYDFQFIYTPGATPASLASATLNVLDGSTVIGTRTFQTNSDGASLESQYLGGPGYIWLPQWQNGFSNDVLGIDNIFAGTVAVPEPATWAMLLMGFFGLGGMLRASKSRKGSLAAA